MALPTLGVLDKDGAPQTISTLASGRQAAADSSGVALSTEDKAAVDAQTTALQIIDDWDESDRAKVNPIVGQAGISAGAGAVAANTPRVTLASDSPGVTTLGQATMANSLPVAIASNQPGIPAALDSASIYNGATAMTPKFAAIAASSSGNNTLVSAVTSKKIRVLALSLMGNGAVNAKFQSGAGGTDLTGLHYIDAAGGGFVLPFNPAGWFETASNTLLNINLSGAVAVGGCLTYVEV